MLQGALRDLSVYHGALRSGVLTSGGQKFDRKLISSPREGVVEPRRSPEQPNSFCSHDDHVVIF